MPEREFLRKMQLDEAGIDTDQSPLLFLSENTWRVLIAVSTAVVLLLTVYSLSRGITIIFMHLYYFPIVLLAYRYRKTGFYLSVLLSLAYLGCVFYYSPLQPDVIEGAISRAIIFIGVAALIAYLSEWLVKNQEMLRKVSQIQQSSLMNANVWLMLLDAKGRILVWNKAGERISGYPAEEVLGSGAIWKLLYPERDYRDMITGKIARIIAENNFFENLETTIRTKAGEHRTISWNTRGLPKKEGEEDRYIAIGIDITERLIAEEKYRSLFKNVVIGIFRTTPDGRVLSMNPALARMYGYETPEEMIRTVTDIRQQLYMHPQVRDTFKHILSTDGEVRNFIAENRHRDGHPIWISINAKEVKDVSGAVLYYEGTIEDITVRKLAEEALKKKHEDLEAAYEEITATEEELRVNYEDLSQKKAKLKESEQYYRTVFENTGTATVVVEENNIISLANDEFANLAGFSKEEIEGKKSWTEFVVKEDLEQMLAQHRLRRQNRKQALRHYEFRFVTRSGDIRNIFLSIDVIPGTKKSVASLLDITDRKRAEEALRESRQILEAVLNSITVRVFWKDKKSVYLGCNTPFARDAGFEKPEDIIGKDDYAMGWREQAELYRGDDRTVIASGISKLLFEEPQTTPSGEKIHLLTSKVPLRDASGEIIGVLGTYFDITERKQIEEALKESEERFRTILHSIQTGIIVIDANSHTILDANQKSLDMIGGTKETVLGSVCHSFICPAELGRCPITDLAQTIDSSERILITTRGEKIPILKSVVPTILGGKKVLIESFIDITERKQAEEALQKSYDELEKRVEERTLELNQMNEELLMEIDERNKAEKKVIESLHEKEVLLREIHHRVKNNLQIVSSLLNLQSKYIKDEATLNAIKESQNRVKAMALVHEKLYRSEDISRIDLLEYARFLTTTLFRFYGVTSRQIKLDIAIDDVRVDINTAIPIGLIINELVSNALKHAFPDGRNGEVSLLIRRTGYIITLIVKDSGAGMPVDLDWRNSDSLGLRLVISLVEQMSGTIELDRSAGTAFTIILQEKLH